MKSLRKEIEKEILGKEISLLDLDNKMEEILNTTESLYDYLSETLEQKSFGYITKIDDESGIEESICIEFKIIDKDYEEKLEKDNEYKFEMKVKVINIFEI